MVASAFLLLYDQATFWTVHHGSFIQTLQVLLQGFVHLSFAILCFMVLEATLHADLVRTRGTLPVIRISSVEEALDLLLELHFESCLLGVLMIVVRVYYLVLEIFVLIGNQILEVSSSSGFVFLVQVSAAAVRAPPRMSIVVHFLVEFISLVLQQIFRRIIWLRI